ncbi:rhodanese-like domain-containing protein [Flavihumibacter profundi]|uniref:rhodanese-like domain-containing protein n=1 Tax=Flavihumibacter profundi TaxID=2716883 RepID=UPI001CC5CEE0|nr:rhodanese-like domain-containing protein [Flavihumibacter profundi]MBZ5858277.1 rhodanese-like domain-containing protein [Flavihumibacter profundi]
MEQITAQELQQLLVAEPGTLLVDVREETEHESHNIGGLNIPLSEVVKAAAAIPKKGKVVVYCKRGIRSAIAIQRLEEKFGYTNLVNLQGGLEAIPGKEQQKFN